VPAITGSESYGLVYGDPRRNLGHLRLASILSRELSEQAVSSDSSSARTNSRSSSAGMLTRLSRCLISLRPASDPSDFCGKASRRSLRRVAVHPENRLAYTEGMSTDLLEEALRLSARDRLQLIEALWDTLTEEDIPVVPEERALLDARLVDLETNPGDQSPWLEVKARLEKRHR
jgi:putative addiction module component (TIGR02574 family)